MPAPHPCDRQAEPDRLDAEIAQLEDLLNTGTSAVSVDGVHTRFDLAHARQRLRDLLRLRQRRGQFKTIRLSGGWWDY